MNSNELFNQLGNGDPEMKNARDWVSYKKFEQSVPSILTLEEFVNTVLKKSIITDAKPQLWFSMRYMVSNYLESADSISDDYVDKMLDKINMLHKSIQSSAEFEHIHQFLNVLVEHVSTKRTVVPKEVLEYLNKLYKTKGIT